MSKLAMPATKRIGVLIFSKYQIARESLKCLIDLNPDLNAVGTYGFSDDVENTQGRSAHVAVIDLTRNDRIEIVNELQVLFPQIRVAVIVDAADLDCQANALKLGAVGIVHRDQNPKLLLEAIRQVYRGETWLNQVLLNKILSLDKPRTSGKNFGPYLDTDLLTAREKEVIVMIGEGLKNKQIAERLFISEATVRHHLSSIYGKIGVEDRLNLVIYAYANGLAHVPAAVRLT
jgi:DNA-binding NarL/FixJ family response regulator